MLRTFYYLYPRTSQTTLPSPAVLSVGPSGVQVRILPSASLPPARLHRLPPTRCNRKNRLALDRSLAPRVELSIRRCIWSCLAVSLSSARTSTQMVCPLSRPPVGVNHFFPNVARRANSSLLLQCLFLSTRHFPPERKISSFVNFSMLNFSAIFPSPLRYNHRRTAVLGTKSSRSASPQSDGRESPL